jgi:glycosyltransferase involved in cell wall biosynthesis
MDCYPEVTEGAGLTKKAGTISRLLRWCNRALFLSLDHLVCLDQAMADLLLSQYCRARRELPCSVIPNWEPAAFFAGKRPVTPCSSPTAESLAGRFVLLYLGNAGYAHEFQTLLDAADLLRETSATFLFVGGGASRAWIEQEFARRGLRNVLLQDYVPSKEETRSIMASADCALITLKSWAAGVVSPSKLHANLAMRLPIVYVGPQYSNVDECIERFRCGISCRPGQAGRVADFILSLANDPAAHQEYGRRARVAFEEAYCDLQTLPQWDQVLQGLLQPHELQAPSHPRSPLHASEGPSYLTFSPQTGPADARQSVGTPTGGFVAF